MDINKVRRAIVADEHDKHLSLRLWLLQYAANGRLKDICTAAPIHISRLRAFINKTDDPVPTEHERLRNAYQSLELDSVFNDPD